MKSLVLAIAILFVGCLCATAQELDRVASWSVPSRSEVKADVDQWLAAQSLNEVQQQEIEALWALTDENPTGRDLLDQVTATLAVASPEAKSLVNFCRASRTSTPLPEFKILADTSLPPVVRNNLRLLYGAWLAQHDMHEEALAQWEGLSANDVADPASLLFYTSVCHHRLRDKDACLPAIAQLLENESQVPRRFRELAQLMQADLEPLKPDTLDEIARLMDSIRRRLDLARVGKRVRDEEDEVIAKLDKMIDDLEKQREQQQAQQSAGSPSGGSDPATPLQDSKAAGGTGKGDVDPKKLTDNGNWDKLPPRQRQEALQQISKELPAHYREAIEEYFRKLARESDK
jgi:hypothetical protein